MTISWTRLVGTQVGSVAESDAAERARVGIEALGERRDLLGDLLALDVAGEVMKRLAAAPLGARTRTRAAG